MKQKVLAIIKPLFASKGLAKEELESLAEIAAKNLNETSTDEDVKNVANGLAPYVELMQKSGNRMVTAATEKFKGFVSPEKYKEINDALTAANEKLKEHPAPVEPAITAEQIQKMINDGISAGLAPYREREEKQRLATLLSSNEKLKSIPAVFRERYVLDKEENLDATVSQIENDWAVLRQQSIQSGAFVEAPQSSSTSIDDDIEMLKKINAGK